MRIPFVLVASFALAPTLACAQFNNPAGLSPGTTPQQQPGVVKMHEANAVDRLFVQLLTQGGLAEVEAGTTAASQSRADRIRSFGQWMREAHRAAQDKLDPLARAAGIPVPNAPSDDQKAQLAQLRSTDDAAFDIAYLQQQLVAHQQTANLLMWEIDNGQDPALTSYAADTLREVTHHLATVQLLMSEFAYVAPQGLGATMPVREAAQGRPGG
ncbi:MAG: DUF4142 domain-containing protein [Burkholderiales bacterium]|nr:MAG: DUF4142 domain-containing protein [Burkholderiales bacterium]